MNDLAKTEELSLTVTRHVAASPEKVYNAWLDPETLVRFMGNCKGFSLASAETDPRVGGRFTLMMRTSGTKVLPHTGTYLALVPHSRLAFTWESEFSRVENSTVTIELRPEAGGTAITLTHVRFVDEASRAGHLDGWTVILEGLVATDLQGALQHRGEGARAFP